MSLRFIQMTAEWIYKGLNILDYRVFILRVKFILDRNDRIIIMKKIISIQKYLYPLDILFTCFRLKVNGKEDNQSFLSIALINLIFTHN